METDSQSLSHHNATVKRAKDVACSISILFFKGTNVHMSDWKLSPSILKNWRLFFFF